jgi:hypothetical protein
MTIQYDNFNTAITSVGTAADIDIKATPKGTGAFLVGTTASNGGISGGAPIAVFYQPASARHGIVVSNTTAGYDVGLIWNRAASGNNRIFEFATEGTYTSRGSIDYDRTGGVIRYNTTSDERLKKNISDSTSAISEIMDLKVRQFDWKETNNHVDFGFIAQELLVTCPSAVSVGDNKEDGSIKRPWGIDTSQLVPILVKAVQELQERVKILESK